MVWGLKFDWGLKVGGGKPVTNRGLGIRTLECEKEGFLDYCHFLQSCRKKQKTKKGNAAETRKPSEYYLAASTIK